MIDHITYEPPVATPECDRFDALLPDYLERTLGADDRASADAHLATCARCRALTDDLLAITRDAAALGPIEPPRDLWAGIAARIEAPVVPLGRTGEHASSSRMIVRRADRALFSKRWLAAAAGVLVAVSVGSTYGVMRVAGRTTPTRVAAATPPVAAPAATPTVRPAAPAPVATPTPASPNVTARTSAPRLPSGDARLVAGEANAYAPGMQTYDREIATLRTALRRRTDLDSATVAVVEKSLRIIDGAIAESRRALARDPHSRFLGDQLTRTLDQKVELLRTAVLLPSRS